MNPAALLDQLANRRHVRVEPELGDDLLDLFADEDVAGDPRPVVQQPERGETRVAPNLELVVATQPVIEGAFLGTDVYPLKLPLHHERAHPAARRDAAGLEHVGYAAGPPDNFTFMKDRGRNV